jgi:RNA polymerase sigma-70 factor (ECF subfamily)
MGIMTADPGTPIGSADLLRVLGGGRADGPPDAAATRAWHELVERYGAYAWTICWRILEDRDASEEAAQELWLHVRAKAHLFKGTGPDPEASARAWLAQLATTCSLHALRRRRRERSHRRPLTMDRAADPVPTTDHEHLRLAVRHELEAMPEADGTALSLRYIAGCDYAEVGSSLGCSPQAARVRVHRALKRLRSRLSRGGAALGAAGGGMACDDILPGFASGCIAAVPPPPPQLLAHWHGLLSSPLHPAASSAALPLGSKLMAKLSLAAASVAAAAVLSSALSSANAVIAAADTPPPAPAETAPAAPGPQVPAQSSSQSSSQVSMTTVNGRTQVTVNGRPVDLGGALGAAPGSQLSVTTVDGRPQVTVNGRPVDPASVFVDGQPGQAAPVERTWLGVETGEASVTLDHQLHLAEHTGLEVETVLPDSPAAAAGIKAYDVLTHIDDHLLTDPDQLDTLLDTYADKQVVSVRLLREGKEVRLEATLGRHLDHGPRDPRQRRLLVLRKKLQKEAQRMMEFPVPGGSAPAVPAPARPTEPNPF